MDLPENNNVDVPVTVVGPVVVPPVAETPSSPVVLATVKPKSTDPVVGQTSAPYGMGFITTPTAPIETISTGPVENKNVELLIEYTTPPVPLLERKDLDGTRELLPFLAERGSNVDERIRAYVSPKDLQTGPGLDWNRSVVAAASSTAYYDSRFENTLNREGAAYKQYLATESGKIGFRAPSLKEAGVGTFTGERAMHRVRSILGLAGQISVPMFHSGFWITLEAPSDSALIELQRRIQEEKIELGRETYGLVFSNEQCYVNSFLLDFCLDHVHSHSVRVDNNQDLKRLIKIQDMNLLFWGMACLIWPRGFDYVRSLMTVEGIENTQVVSGKISIGKLLWVDNASFDPKQAAHFSNTQRHQMTVETVLEYQKTFVPSLAAGRLLEIHEGLSLLINSTNVENYINDGANWISSIVQTVDSTFTQAPPDEKSRNRMIETHARASTLRNYGSWISAVVIDGHENTDRFDISNTLDLLSTEPEITTKIIEAVSKFIDDSTRALIAIPETTGATNTLPLFPNLIPIDVVNTFFTLLVQRVDIIASR